MVVEMQMMKEWMDFMMNALKGWVSSDLDDLVHRINSPFTAFVTLFPLPSKFYMPQVESYTGSKDPLDHLESFKTLMHLQGVCGRDYVQGLSHYAEGPCKDLVQQVIAQFHWYLQGVERPVCLALYRGTQV